MKCIAFPFLLLAFSSTLHAQHYVITQYGAVTDSNRLNTAAIQRTIDSASEKGGGTIVIPKGTFLTGALFFKPKTKLLLQEGAVLKGSDNIDDYPLIPSRMEGKNLLYYAALINAYYTDSFSITGPGTINGNGLKFWQQFWQHREDMKKIGKSSTNLEVHRPRLLFIWGCDHVSITKVSLRDAGFWTTHLYQCNDVLVEDCSILSPYKPVPAPSTDGIDIDACKKVTIRRCYISVNDDAVCIKGGKGPAAHKSAENGVVEDILIEDCTFGESHGTLTLGSECIHARNIILRNCTVNNNCPILRMKMRPDTYQVYENISISHITGKCGTLVQIFPWKQFFNLEGSKEKPFGTIRNITLSDIKADCNKFAELEGNAGDTVSRIFFKNITVTAPSADFKNKYSDVIAEGVTINGSPLIIKQN